MQLLVSETYLKKMEVYKSTKKPKELSRQSKRVRIMCKKIINFNNKDLDLQSLYLLIETKKNLYLKVTLYQIDISI